MIRNKNVLITGASSGIGEALAVYYAQNGADNLFICGRNAERLAKVREACERYGAKVSAEVLDVTQREAVKNWVERCNVSANLNIVIANAGTGTINETEEAVLNTFNTNVNGVINTVLPALAAYRSRPFRYHGDKAVAVISSMAGYHGLPTCPAYSASKACVKAWGEALRPVLKREGIRMSVVCPGFVRSRITDQNTCPMPFFMEAPQAAEIIARGIEADKGIIAFPWPLRPSAAEGIVLPRGYLRRSRRMRIQSRARPGIIIRVVIRKKAGQEIISFM